jgi:hypothetical protein
LSGSPEERAAADAAADAQKEHVPGRGPTPEEEAAADRVAGAADESVARHEHEMQELGADVKGEGQPG